MEVEVGYLTQSQDMRDVMPARVQQEILGSDHGQEEAMDMVHRLLIGVTQVRETRCDRILYIYSFIKIEIISC